MSNALTVRPQMNMSEIETAAQHLAKSGFFTDAKSISQAVVKVMAGQELGLPPFASMSGIHIIQGRPALGANVIATLIKNDPRYDYLVNEMTDSVCDISFFEHGKEIGVSTFTAADATRAQTKNMNKFPRNMLFARAISNGARWYTPGIFGGTPVYTPEELGADVDEDGYIVGEVVEQSHQSNGVDWSSVSETVSLAELPNAGRFDGEPTVEVDWRSKVAKTRNLTVATLASMVANAGYRDNMSHAAASIVKHWPDLEGSGHRLSNDEALVIFDAYANDTLPEVA